MRYSNIGILLTIALATACEFELDENTPLGNKNLSITGINPTRGLRGDTLTIYGTGFNSIAYQNEVGFEVDPTTSGDEIRIVDASPDSLKVIIPDNAATGDVKVFFGVDTVKSPDIFELISNVKRPTILSVDPEFAAPGTEVTIIANLEGGEPVVLFGETYVNVSSSESLLEFLIRVPSLLPGPVDLRAGIITPEQDTLWSKPVSFGVLPGITNLPVTVWTSYSGLYDISKGELTEDGGIEVGVLYPENVPGTTKQGVALNTVNSNVYWISNNGSSSGSVLYRGKTTGETRVASPALGKQFHDIAISNGYLYLTGGLDDIDDPGRQNIRRYQLDNNGSIITNTARVMYQDGSKSAITNLKIAGSNFYWCDSVQEKIYKGTINDDLLQPQATFTTEDLLIHPIAIAIDETNDVFYIADRTGSQSTDRSILWKASFSSPGELTKLYEKQTAAKITDLEIDIENRFLYWITTEGVFRKGFDNLTGFSSADPTPVYNSTGGNYFDF